MCPKVDTGYLNRVCNRENVILPQVPAIEDCLNTIWNFLKTDFYGVISSDNIFCIYWHDILLNKKRILLDRITVWSYICSDEHLYLYINTLINIWRKGKKEEGADNTPQIFRKVAK